MLKKILEQATKLDATSRQKAFKHLNDVLQPLASTHYIEINTQLLELPIHLYSTAVLMDTLTMAYYYRFKLDNYHLFLQKVWQEIVLGRGETELGDTIDLLW